MSVDLWSMHLHAEAFADDPPCKCGCAEELHAAHECGGCFDCEGYRPMDPRDLERDEPMED